MIKRLLQVMKQTGKVAIAVLLTVQMATLNAAVPWSENGTEVKSSAAELKALQAQIDRLEALVQQVLTIQAAQVSAAGKDMLKNAETRAKADLEDVGTRLSGNAKNLLDSLNKEIADLPIIDQKTPKAVTDLFTKKGEEIASKILTEVEKAQAQFKKTLGTPPKFDVTLDQLGTVAMDKLTEAILRLDPSLQKNLEQFKELPQILDLFKSYTAPGDTWSAALIASLPPQLLPKSLQKHVIETARESHESTLAAQSAGILLNQIVMSAMATGNPYIIATAAIIALLAFIFGGGGGGGGGGKSPGPTPGPTPADKRNEPTFDTGDISRIGKWPVYEFSKGEKSFKIDLSKAKLGNELVFDKIEANTVHFKGVDLDEENVTLTAPDPQNPATIRQYTVSASGSASVTEVNK